MNSRGDVLLMGIKGCSVNQQRLNPQSSGGRWLTDDSVIYQRGGPPFVLDACEWPSQLIRTIDLRGANEIKAAGGHWAAYLANDGVRTSWGLHLPTAGLVGLASDRTLAIVNAGTGINLRLVLANGAIVPLGGNALGMVLLDEHTAIWNDYQGRVHTYGLPVPAIPGFVHAILDVHGHPWALKTYQDRLLLHPLASTFGYEVATGQHLYAPCAVVDGRIKVAWSYGAGEEPSDLRTAWIDSVSPRTDLRVAAPPITPAPLPSSIPKLGRPAIWAYWKTLDLTAPMNVLLVEQPSDLALARTTTLPLIVLRPMLPSIWPYWARVLAVLIHEEGGQAAVEAQARLARLAMGGANVPTRDVMTYTGKNLHPTAKGVDIHGIQAYLQADTPNPANEMRKLITKAAGQFGPHQKLILHGQAYDRRNYNDPTRRPRTTAEGWTDVEGLQAMQTVYPAVLKTDSRIVGCIWFCDGERQGGTRDYPELAPYHARCVAVTPGPPPISVPAPPPPPHPDPPEPPEEPPVPTCNHPARTFAEVYQLMLRIDAYATEHARALKAGEHMHLNYGFFIEGKPNSWGFEWTKGHLAIQAPIPADPQ